jgi:MFS family permease
LKERNFWLIGIWYFFVPSIVIFLSFFIEVNFICNKFGFLSENNSVIKSWISFIFIVGLSIHVFVSKLIRSRKKSLIYSTALASICFLILLFIPPNSPFSLVVFLLCLDSFFAGSIVIISDLLMKEQDDFQFLSSKAGFTFLFMLSGSVVFYYIAKYIQNSYFILILLFMISCIVGFVSIIFIKDPFSKTFLFSSLLNDDSNETLPLHTV